MSETTAIAREKSALRARLRSWRAGLDSKAKVDAAQVIADRGLELLMGLLMGLRGDRRPGTVSGFASMPDELNIWPLLRRLHGANVPLALPVVEGKGRPLLFRSWQPGDDMDKGVWGIPQPGPEQPVVEPDILLVPLLAFDARGGRLGYGGGFYDRTLAGLRARKPIVAVGLAYAGQQVDVVPHLDYDEKLDWVLTPSGPMRCSFDASVAPR